MPDSRSPHFTGSGRPKLRFRSYFDAKRFLERRELVGVRAYWCPACRGIHLGHSQRLPSSLDGASSESGQGEEGVIAQEARMATALGARLKQIREHLGLTRSEVARRAQIDPAQLHRLENGDNADPTFKAIVRLSRVLGVSLSWLAMAEDEIAAPPSDHFVLDDEVRRAIVVAAESLRNVVESFASAEPALNDAERSPVKTKSVSKRLKK